MLSICLNMIVKNESEVIVQTLENIIQHLPIHYWVISDTGSTDNTVELIQSFFAQYQIQGEVFHDVWQDFAHNRNLALAYCEGKSDYIYISDADDRLTGELKLPELHADAYELRMCAATREFYFYKKLLLRNNQSFKWVGVLHEALVATQSNLQVNRIVGDYFVRVGHFGHRSQDPVKHLKDAKLLENAFKDESDPALKARYAYYCGCSFHDAAEHRLAIEWYLRRIEIGRINGEELWLSYLYLGMQFEILQDFAQAKYYWLKGYDAFPDRAECLYHAIRISADQQQFHVASHFLDIALKINMPQQGESIERNVYIYGLRYESARVNLALDRVQNAFSDLMQLIILEPHSQYLCQLMINSLLVCLQKNVQVENVELNLILTRIQFFQRSYPLLAQVDTLEAQLNLLFH